VWDVRTNVLAMSFDVSFWPSKRFFQVFKRQLGDTPRDGE